MEEEKLLEDIETARRCWDERSSFVLEGVGNLSVSDLDTLELYAETYKRCGSCDGLMKPVGGVKSVLKRYGLVVRG